MYSFFKIKITNFLKKRNPAILEFLNQNKTGLKYMISGGTAALLNIALLFILTDIVGLWYFISSVVVYIISTLFNFVLLKFWAFRDPDLGRIHKQLAIFTVLASINFFISPSLLVFLVEILNLWYITGQVLVLLTLAITNFIINKKIVFKDR